MSHNTLLEKIKADAAAEVAKIKEASQAEIAALQRETDRALEEKRAVHQAALDKELAQLELVGISKAKQASKIALQTAKREEIDSLFAEVESELAGLPSDDYVKLFTKYATEIIPEGVEAVSASTAAGREAETAAVLKARGVSCEVVVDPKIKAGFVLQAADGVYDITLTRLMSEARSQLEMEVVKKVLA